MHCVTTRHRRWPVSLLGAMAFEANVALSDWLDSARAQWRSRRRDGLAELAGRLEAEDRIAEALVVAERLTRDEPLFEHGHRRLMRLHYRRGDRAAALAASAHLHETLARELDVEPNDETQALVRLIEGSGDLPVARKLPPAALARPPRLTGRDDEWRAMEAAWQGGRLIVLRGEPGIGKSRLLGDFASAYALRKVGARPGDARVPYATLARLVRALGLDHDDGPALSVSCRRELARLAPELGEAAPGRIDADRLQAALIDALAATGGEGIALDDLQFADEATLAMLPALVAAGGRWAVALRRAEQPAAVTAWIDALDTEALAVVEPGPLGVGAVTQLLADLALPDFDAAAWGPRIHRHCGGNPLFILETVRAWPADAQAGDDPADLPLPPSLRLLVERRLARLSGAALKLARVAAVAGQDFDVDLAAQVLGAHPLDLSDPWQELEAAQVLQGAGFAHDLVHEATRDAVPAVLRQWLHGRIAEWLQQHDGAPARLAAHWMAAGAPAQAARAYERAAQVALMAGRLAEQARWLEAAIDAFAQAGQMRERFDARVRLTIAAREAQSPDLAMQSAQALLDQAGDERERAIGLTQLAVCHMNAARFDLAHPMFDEAIRAAEAAGDDHTASHARFLQALATARTEGLTEALSRMAPLIPWARAQADPSLRHSLLVDLAILYDQADQRRRARPLFEQALAYFDGQRETGNATPTRLMLARSLTMLGDLDQARDLLETAVRERAALSEGAGGYGVEVLNLGRVYVELGLYREALDLLEPARHQLQGPSALVVRGAIALVAARAQCHLGQAARAIQLCREVPADVPAHLRASLSWTQALLAHDRPADRRDRLDEALACLRESADLPFLRLPIAFDRLACEPDAAALAALRDGVAECEQRELPAPQMLGRMRLLQVLCALHRFRAALPVARSLMADLAGCHPIGCYLPELLAAVRAAALGGGDLALAEQSQDRAVKWIARVANHHVPVLHRDGFLQRNPVNRAILAASLPQ